MNSINQGSFFSSLPEQIPSSSNKTPQLFSLTLDSSQWMQFLVDEWYIPSNPTTGIHLGVNTLIGDQSVDNQPAVVAWINPRQLMELNVSVRLGSHWYEQNIWDIDPMAEEIFWPAPLPLFAVSSFSTESEQSRAWLFALSNELTRGKTGLPPLVARSSTFELIPPVSMAPKTRTLTPPENWNSLRGAAAMAVWALPANEPWFQILASTLSFKECLTIADKMEQSWVREMPWRVTSSEIQAEPEVILWRSLLNVISVNNYRSGWRPQVILAAIIEEAISMGATGKAFEEFSEETYDILCDRKRIDVRRSLIDPVGLIIQLILLRPTADRFVTWKDELSSMAPVVWWAGATISGYITGFRDLEPRFSGLPEGRKLLALRTWQIASKIHGEYWKDELTEANIEWRIDDSRIRLTCADIPWAERTENNRGKWYRADYSNEEIRQAALNLASKHNPRCTRNSLHLRDISLNFVGEGTLTLEDKRLKIEGDAKLILPQEITVKLDLIDEDFRNWLVWGGIESQLPPPPPSPSPSPSPSPLPLPSPSPSPSPMEFLKKRPTTQGLSERLFPDALNEESVPGLVEFENFMSFAEEQSLVQLIDDLPWQNSLSRRVQHYGWLYDYKAAAVSISSKLGPLPIWAQHLAQRLIEKKLISEMPDQVIVNEYVKNQGISKHIDSPTSFIGPVITISLLESWDMVFRHPSGKKVTRTLERCSAVILNGPARYEWTHEIPKRSKEKWGTRGRRISLTFRKVNLETMQGNKKSGDQKTARPKKAKLQH